MMEKKASLQEEIKKLSQNCRLERTRILLSEIVDMLLGVMELHASNWYLVHSNEFAIQFNSSIASNTLQLLKRTVLEKELLLINRIWDKPDSSMNHRCLPLARCLLNNVNLDDLINQQALASQPNKTELHIKSDVKNALSKIQATSTSDELKNIRNFRSKHLAHSLTNTRAEKNGPLPSPNYGHISELLETTISITEVLYLLATGASFDFENSSRIYKKQSAAFWPNLHFHSTIKD